jgi:hypothetical protein
MLIGHCFGLCLIDSMTGSAIKRYIMCWGKFLVIFLLYLLANADTMYCIEVICVVFRVFDAILRNDAALTNR